MKQLTLVQELAERALEAGCPKNVLYLKAIRRIEELEKELAQYRAKEGPSPGTMRIR